MTFAISAYDTSDDGAIRAAWRVVADTAAHDEPDLPPMTFEYYRSMVGVRGDDFEMIRLMARRDGVVVGLGGLHLSLVDNQHMADALVRVHPDARRQGVGRALLEAMAAAVRARGRRVLIGRTQSALPGGVARPGDGGPFALAVGAREGLRSVIRRLDLTNPTGFGEIEATVRAASTGYEVVTWAGLTPDDLLPGLANLASRINVDAPIGDLDITGDSPDPEHYRRDEQRQAAAGHRAYTAVARHRATGEVAAYTRLLVDPRSDHADQLGTLVLTAHRGHRLGLLLKIENLQRVRAAEPALRRIFTQNAGENAYMVAINDAVGFRPYAADITWQLKLGS